ncbi:class I SAM-dependent methyltransferase [Vibrio anguillarum]|uniref:Methyltransferase n=1 Tax=Vibrio aestuarianus TaxID=28171 RepID=A0A9X4F458_9VIBR|nr:MULTISPECIES: class I SAM-dependent methyltransferase [Vibrio]MBD1563989.1 class I SAM-dependent methyltransferase [Vibrio sp. S12_S33]MDE1244024.1 methyltransferase [Vibrio aestuarianus]MDQ2189951.1 class I SAM-dependent methyltransferase [Vibrio sp. A14(2019)]MDQ2195857.1 class I SAM-dependent methyltransferase [Vibrio sp. 2017_1457_11]NNN74696.1 class I SAM-dependent methyltransferase [Vibrio sp. B7]
MNKQLLNDFLRQEECPHLLMDFGNPAFSERMLKEHLDQNSEFASRKLDEIERQVDFLYQHYLRPGDKVLDLACGPGLYTSMLANRQVHCTGFDISPAAIHYAQQQASHYEHYQVADLNQFKLDTQFDLVLMLFGIANNLKDLDGLLAQLRSNLKPEGKLVIELMDLAFMKSLVAGDGTWTYMHEGGLLSDNPHYQLCRRIWHEDEGKLIDRNLIIDDNTQIQVFEGLFWGYCLNRLDDLLENNGFLPARIICHELEKGELTQHFFLIETALMPY